MASLVADTHALVWHLTDQRKLGKGARRAFAAADEGRSICHVPAIVLAEVALLHERGRIRVGPAQVLEAIAAHPGYAVLPLDIEQALELAALATLRDPWDRLIVSAARVTASKLVSCDEALEGFGVDRLWD